MREKEMGYQSRKRNFRSRRERFEDTMRKTRLFFLFLFLAILVYLFMNRYEFWAYLKTYLY
ncbi:hypothetical protein [Phaeodactylibacter sp.]|uniref:hypothetical protein n=1 Tax=Phaeodactylibacter sp. TaxID=1940289 RepID=UPI0032EBA955